MPLRLERRGRLIAREGERAAVAVEAACGGCAAGCSALPPRPAAVDVRLAPGFSGRIGDRVTLSVSASGLFFATGLAFAPATVVLLGSPWITASVAPAGGVVLTGVGLALALLAGGALVRRFSARLVRPEIGNGEMMARAYAGSGESTEPTDGFFAFRNEDVQCER